MIQVKSKRECQNCGKTTVHARTSLTPRKGFLGWLVRIVDSFRQDLWNPFRCEVCGENYRDPNDDEMAVW